MKLIHLSDLHIGKRVNEYSMLDDQKYILLQILNIIDNEKPDGVIIAGDVYDKSVPSAEAVEVFDDFLTKLAKRNVKTFVISGNHDSPERLSFGSRLMEHSGIYISKVYDGKVEPISISDAYGEMNVYLLPFIKPLHVRLYCPEAEINTYNDALRVAVENMNVDMSKRNVLVTHQFITNSKTSDSEEISVGGTDNVDASVFDCFDYVALGHIHGPQNCGSEKIRYCGTPLKYSFSEVNHKKSVTVVEINEKESLDIRTVELVPLRDMYEIRGKFEEIMQMSFYENTPYQESYMRIILTDEDDIPNALGTLRTVYHKLMKLEYDNTRTRTNNVISAAENVENKSEFELFSEFFEKQNGQAMTDVQSDFIKSLIEELKEASK